jgi:hypothetical protein
MLLPLVDPTDPLAYRIYFKFMGGHFEQLAAKEDAEKEVSAKKEAEPLMTQVQGLTLPFLNLLNLCLKIKFSPCF